MAKPRGKCSMGRETSPLRVYQAQRASPSPPPPTRLADKQRLAWPPHPYLPFPTSSLGQGWRRAGRRPAARPPLPSLCRTCLAQGEAARKIQNFDFYTGLNVLNVVNKSDQRLFFTRDGKRYACKFSQGGGKRITPEA